MYDYSVRQMQNLKNVNSSLKFHYALSKKVELLGKIKICEKSFSSANCIKELVFKHGVWILNIMDSTANRQKIDCYNAFEIVKEFKTEALELFIKYNYFENSTMEICNAVIISHLGLDSLKIFEKYQALKSFKSSEITEIINHFGSYSIDILAKYDIIDKLESQDIMRIIRHLGPDLIEHLDKYNQLVKVKTTDIELVFEYFDCDINLDYDINLHNLHNLTKTAAFSLNHGYTTSALIDHIKQDVLDHVTNIENAPEILYELLSLKDKNGSSVISYVLQEPIEPELKLMLAEKTNVENHNLVIGLLHTFYYHNQKYMDGKIAYIIKGYDKRNVFLNSNLVSTLYDKGYNILLTDGTKANKTYIDITLKEFIEKYNIPFSEKLDLLIIDAHGGLDCSEIKCDHKICVPLNISQTAEYDNNESIIKTTNLISALIQDFNITNTTKFVITSCHTAEDINAITNSLKDNSMLLAFSEYHEFSNNKVLFIVNDLYKMNQFIKALKNAKNITSDNLSINNLALLYSLNAMSSITVAKKNHEYDVESITCRELMLKTVEKCYYDESISKFLTDYFGNDFIKLKKIISTYDNRYNQYKSYLDLVNLEHHKKYCTTVEIHNYNLKNTFHLSSEYDYGPGISISAEILNKFACYIAFSD